jgi:uncharacterized protein
VTLLEQIKADQLQARKDRLTLKATLLTTLIGEAVMKGKNDGNRESTDDEVVEVVKKFIKNINDTIKFLTEGGATETDERLITVKNERQILEAYLPQQLTEDQIVGFLKASGLQTAGINKGICMKYLKENFAGRYDGKVASAAVDRFISTGQ